MRMLVSVRSVDEAIVAAEGGVDFIDLKEPRAGALGSLPVETIRAIVDVLRSRRTPVAVESSECLESGAAASISATIGDVPMHDLPAILQRVDAVGRCGVDYVKVGIERRPGAVDVLAALGTVPWAVVPVFIADEGIDFDLVGQSLGFPAVMVDTADKLRGSLFEAVPVADLRRFVERIHGAGRPAGLAGALLQAHLPRLAALGPDFAGFRSAVCRERRDAVLDASLLQELVAATRRLASGAAGGRARVPD